MKFRLIKIKALKLKFKILKIHCSDVSNKGN